MQISSIQPLPPASLAETRPAQTVLAQARPEPPPPPKPFVPAPPIRPTLQDNIDIVNALMMMRQI